MVCSEYSMTRHDTHPGSHTINRPMLLADFSFRLLLYLVYSLPRACYQVPPAPFFFTLVLSSFWTCSQVSSLLPPGSCFPSVSFAPEGSAIPLLVDFSSSVANSRSARAFRKSICAQEKVPTNLHEYALGRIRTHETDLYQARG